MGKTLPYLVIGTFLEQLVEGKLIYQITIIGFRSTTPLIIIIVTMFIVFGTVVVRVIVVVQIIGSETWATPFDICR